MRLSGSDRRAPSAFSAARALRIILVSMASMGAACGVAGAQSDPLQLGASYLKGAQTSDGLFNYEFNFLSSKYSSQPNESTKEKSLLTLLTDSLRAIL